MCHRALQCVQHCLYLPTMDESFSLLSEDCALHMVMSLILVMERLKKKASTLSILKAYLLALFSHLITKFLGDLHVGLFGPESLVELFENEDKQKEEEEESDDKAKANKPSDDSGEKKRKKVTSRDVDRRRRRGRGSLEDDDESSSESRDEDSDSSSANEESDGDVSDSDMSDDSDLYNNGLHSDSDEDEEYSSDEDDVIVESSKDILSTINLVKLVGRHRFVPAIRACGFWLRQCPEVVADASDPTSSGVLWTRLAKLFTLLSLKNPLYEGHDTVNSLMENMSGTPSDSFPEDFYLSKIVTVDEASRARGSYGRGLEDEDQDVVKGIFRILSLRNLRDWLCQNPDTKLSLSKDNHEAVVLTNKETAQEEPQENGKVSPESNSQETDAEAKQKMMRNMAQLWLRQEVHELECDSARRGRGSHGGLGVGDRGTLSGFAHYSPYLVLDHLALSTHLPLVKEVVASRRFAVIVPTVVVHLLDEMKKEEAGARMAIRWLEKQFRDGNHWLRPQRKEEARTLDNVEYPKKKQREAWQYFKVLECCNHFAGVNVEDATTECFQVSLLTSGQKDLIQAARPLDAESETSAVKDKDDVILNPKVLGEAIGIKVENIDSFIKHANTGKDIKRGRERRGQQMKVQRMKMDVGGGNG